MNSLFHKTSKENQQLKRLIIVDDEPIICEGLRKTIDWGQLGIEVVDVAYDGEEALNIIQSQPIDIVLSDIRMDGMDGLKLAERIRGNYPNIRIVMISGYEDFDYARSAMRLGVSDYLLKPVDIDELKSVVIQIVESINEKNIESNIEIGKDDESLWFKNAIQQNFSDEEVVPLRRLVGASGTYTIIASQLMDYYKYYGTLNKEEKCKLQQDWTEHIQSYLQEAGMETIISFYHPNVLFVFIYDKKQSDNSLNLENKLKEISTKWKRENEMYFAISEPYHDSKQTSAICEQVRKLLPYHMLHEGTVLSAEHCVLIESIRKVNCVHSVSQEWVSQLGNILHRQDWVEAEKMVRDFVKVLRDKKYLCSELVAIFEEHKVLLRQRLHNNSFSLEQLQENQQNIDLNIHNTYTSVEQEIVDEVHQLFELVGTQCNNKSFWIVEKAMKYVAENYSDDIKAFEIALWLNITPNHFSNIFKQKTGKNFKEYINDVRINHAKRLLAGTNDKVFEIADRVGYKEYKYFVSVFKSVTGMTPKEYRSIYVNV